MTLVNLNFIQFYQFSIKVDLADKQLLMVLVNNIYIVCKNKYALTVFKFITK